MSEPSGILMLGFEPSRYWNAAHDPDAVPLDLWELIRALVTEQRRHLEPEDRITQESILVYVQYLTQFNTTRLDAYRLYGGRDNLTITVGIRYGNEASQYMSPYLSREIADQFNLDPLNKDIPPTVYPDGSDKPRT